MPKPKSKAESAARYARRSYQRKYAYPARPGVAGWWKRQINRAIRRFWKKEMKDEDSQ